MSYIHVLKIVGFFQHADRRFADKISLVKFSHACCLIYAARLSDEIGLKYFAFLNFVGKNC
jgi:hypothetical protein